MPCIFLHIDFKGENPEKNQHIGSEVYIKNGYVLTAARCLDRNKNIAKNWMVKSLSYIGSFNDIAPEMVKI